MVLMQSVSMSVLPVFSLLLPLVDLINLLLKKSFVFV